ncbi:aldose 1-epimerase family protein [Aeromonas simiae]|uniref:aldose 1-epimerase family protein n=1 Tax=Aeromonas simiae TaxID=218936 RepID=UPI00266C627C|nr:aldose 1-epimerase family protein [Aeromonas simiae]MDO2948955.1 aldose 1-epimerase family protein [Aeromonas simiae]MDO2952443.1 aldose 1-epimerase family protein [Aeromonas simiae]MDO2956651.1 aldose 1-epimerase family protein [Aeromonas simiae]
MKVRVGMGLLLCCALPLQAANFVLVDTAQGLDVGNWKVSSDSLGIKSKIPFSIEKKRLHGGRQEGVDVIVVDNGTLQMTLVPTRGMGIYEVRGGDLRLGWESPVKEIVNPAFIDLESRGGLGWLDGFNEMLVRCGYEWTGHPGVDDDGRLKSLHGRVQNTPASVVRVTVDETPPYAIHVRGRVDEKTFKFSDLSTWTGVTLVPGEAAFTVEDKLTNQADYDNEYQIIYHGNFGAPLLEEGARISAPVKQISPFNDYARKGLDSWQTYLGPTKGFDEMVFNIVPYSDAKGNTLAVLENRAGNAGVAVDFNVKQLPVLTLWKNTDTLQQGYVTGIEPGTSYAYSTKYQRPLGLVPTIKPGESKYFTLRYQLLRDKGEVQAALDRVKAVQGSQPTELRRDPLVQLPH